MVYGELHDIIEVLGEEEGGVDSGPDHTHVGGHHGEDWAGGDEVPHRDVSQCRPHTGGWDLLCQKTPLCLGGQLGLSGVVCHEDDPGQGPGQREAAEDVESDPPVVMVADVARHQGGEHGAGRTAGVDDGGEAASLRQRLPPGYHGTQGRHHQAPRQPTQHLGRDQKGDGEEGDHHCAQPGDESDQEQEPLAPQYVGQRTSGQHREDHPVVVAGQDVGHLLRRHVELLLHGQDGQPQTVPAQQAHHVAKEGEEGEDVATGRHLSLLQTEMFESLVKFVG